VDLAESKQNIVSTGSIIVLATIGSFVASSTYVLGLSIGLQQPLYEFFQLKDYLEVTPAWLEPSALYLLVVGLVSFLGPFIFRDKDPDRVSVTMSKILFWVFIVVWLGGVVIFIVKKDSKTILFFAGLILIFAAWQAFRYTTRIVWRRRPSKRKAVWMVIYAGAASLFIAFTSGYAWTPQWIALSKESTVTVGDAKGDMREEEVHGKIVLHLERYLLLQDKDGTLVAISTSQIKRIAKPF
jgi:hypothetical protein